MKNSPVCGFQFQLFLMKEMGFNLIKELHCTSSKWKFHMLYYTMYTHNKRVYTGKNKKELLQKKHKWLQNEESAP